MTQLITVIGGDARYLELIRQLRKLSKMKIILVGYDKLEQGFTEVEQMNFRELNPYELDIVILPITGTDNQGNVEVIFSNKTITLTDDWFSRLNKSALIFSGMMNDYLDNITKKHGLELIPLLDRDDVAIYNSIPTAEGTIMMAMRHTDFTIHSTGVIVAGFGRVGHTVANKFSALGAKGSVAASSIHDLARTTEMYLKAIPLNQLHQYTDYIDVLINTIPAKVIKKESIQQLPSHALIFDLASIPGGTDFKYAEQRGIKAILAKSLPGVVAPKTAGRILADVIKQIIVEKGVI